MLLAIGIILFWSAAAQALYIAKGIHGMKWGDSISNYERMVEVHHDNLSKFYVKSGTFYYAANERVSRVSYGFYRDQLYAAFIKLRSANQFSKLAQTFSDKHGTPRVSYEDAGKQIIFRWKVDKIKIKLKMKDSIGMYKLAFYYSPLAEQLNQAQLDQIPLQAYGPEPSDGHDPAQTLPLIEY
jgi:hypothetical protein